MTEVYKFLDSLHIDKKDTLVVAVSYGPDSMFLLNLLKNKYMSNKIVCAHVHHNHRKESDEEARLLEKYCNDNNVIFEMMKIKEYTNNNFTEEEARIKRYEFFDSIMIKYKSSYLFTAHHGDDLCETILMRLARGSNINGYSGIKLKSIRKNYEMIRPLLYLTKKDIQEYCIKEKIPYAVDKSNESNLYTRNRYRNGVLKLLKDENKNIHEKFLSFSSELQEYDNYIKKVVNKEYLNVVNDNVILVNKIVGLDNLIQKKIIEKYLLEEYQDDIKNIDEKHVNLILDMINSSKSNMKLDMPLKKNIVKSYNKIYFDKTCEYNSYCYVFDDFLELPYGYAKKIDKLEDTSNYTIAFDSKDITLPLYFRSKIDGDKMEVLNLKGSKKIKNIFIDEKIDVTKRESYPILVDSNGHILWVPGVKKSKYDKSKTGKYDIILRYYKEEK